MSRKQLLGLGFLQAVMLPHPYLPLWHILAPPRPMRDITGPKHACGFGQFVRIICQFFDFKLGGVCNTVLHLGMQFLVL